MSTFSKQALQEKLSRLSLSQDSIETLSLWIIHHKAHAKSSIEMWLEEIQRGRVKLCHVTMPDFFPPSYYIYPTLANADKRLVLFYLANDILQNGRRRGADVFLDLFQDPLRQAVTLIG